MRLRFLVSVALLAFACTAVRAQTVTNLSVTPSSPGVFDSNHVTGVSGDFAPGFASGSFASDGVAKTDMYFTPEALFGHPVTIADVASVSYWTKKSTTHTPDLVDWSYLIYTKPYAGDVSTPTWYGDRIGSEPYFAINLADPGNNWNKWSTDGAANRMRFYESTQGAPGANFGTYNDPDWATFKSGNALSGSPYGGHEILFFSVQTGSATAPGFFGQVDGVRILLNDGSVANINFESNEGPVIYNSTVVPLHGNQVSVGAEAYGFKEIGDLITFAGTERNLATVKVTMSSWGCQNGHWNTADCVTTPGATFSIPITLNIYNAGDPTPGAPIATKTQTFSIPYRPSSDTAHCGDGRWYDGTNCFNGLAHNITFDLSSMGITLPNSVVYGLTYNTTNYGPNPIGTSAACFSSSAGCPYDSLNVALSPVVTVGSKPFADTLYWNNAFASNYCDSGAAGINLFRLDSPSNACWFNSAPGDSLIPAVRFTVTPTAPDLVITKTADRNPVPVGANFNYDISVTNTGTPASNVVVTDPLPSQVTLTAMTTSQGTCSYNSGTKTVTCSLGTVNAGAPVNIRLTVKAQAEGTLDNTATVTTTDTDSNPSNNSASVNGVLAQKFVDLAVQKTTSTNPVFAGQNVIYTITVKNTNVTTAATGVVLSDPLPASETFVSATTSQGSLVTPPVGSTGTVTANLGTIAPGATATVTITAKTTSAGAVTNSAVASSIEGDFNLANNSDSASVVVKSAALLKVLLASQVLTGGCQNTTGNVYLTGPAGPGGDTVSLASTVSGASVPASVFIPEGQSVSPAFNVTTSQVAAKQVGTINATLGATTVGRGITINKGSGTCN
jgi:uncharacterized repeat protein (TIGR01451 family)